MKRAFGGSDLAGRPSSRPWCDNQHQQQNADAGNMFLGWRERDVGLDVTCGTIDARIREPEAPDRPVAVKRGHRGPGYSWVFQGLPAGEG